MWPLAIIAAVLIFFTQLMGDVHLHNERVQEARMPQNLAAQFRSYGNLMFDLRNDKNNYLPTPPNWMIPKNLGQAISDYSYSWLNFDVKHWCNASTCNATTTPWGLYVGQTLSSLSNTSASTIYLYYYAPRKDLLRILGQLLAHGAQYVGFKSGSQLLDAQGKPILAPGNQQIVLPKNVQAFVPEPVPKTEPNTEALLQIIP